VSYVNQSHQEPDNVTRHVPLTNLAFLILLALADRDLHGYALIKEIDERSGGYTKLRSGTLYAAMRRLDSAGLVYESGERPAPDRDDQRRRYYGITELGLAVVRAEANRLASLVNAASHKNLIGEGA
jgi:DNA-binding PadR family transcriptional regulator